MIFLSQLFVNLQLLNWISFDLTLLSLVFPTIRPFVNLFCLFHLQHVIVIHLAQNMEENVRVGQILETILLLDVASANAMLLAQDVTHARMATGIWGRIIPKDVNVSITKCSCAAGQQILPIIPRLGESQKTREHKNQIIWKGFLTIFCKLYLGYISIFQFAYLNFSPPMI